VKVLLSSDLSPAALKRAFDATYLERYGHVSPIRVQIVSLRVSCQAPLGARPDEQPHGVASRSERMGTRQVYSPKAGAFMSYAVHDREGLKPGVAVQGPCLIDDHATTTNVPEGWSASLVEGGLLELRRT
jgi:N-methylhydantoinase A/oxoprolinase/acetone carboxylase beta subunit